MADWFNDEKVKKQVYDEAMAGNTGMQCELARVLMEEGNVSEGLSWYKKAASLGMTDAMYNLGVIYSQGADGLEPSTEQAYFWFEEAAKAGDAEAMYMVGTYLLNQGDERGAANWLKESVAAGYLAAEEALMSIPEMRMEREDQLAEIRLLLQYAETYLSRGEHKAAIPCLLEALSQARNKFGNKDAFTVSILNNLAVAYAGCGQYDQSIPLKEEVLELRKKSLPINHPDYITSMTNLSSDYARVGRLQSALELSRQTYAICRENYPLGHELVLLSLNRLSADYMALCKDHLALEQLNAADLLMKRFGFVDKLDEKAALQWKNCLKFKKMCEENVKTHAKFFALSEERKSYAYICAELMEMLSALPADYLSRIAVAEYEHLKEQALLVTCYHPHLTRGERAETDPYTNTLQTLLSLKYLMPSMAQCQEESDLCDVRAVVTWVENELCLILTVYPKKATVKGMEHPQPIDFVKSLNACDEKTEPVLSLEAVDLSVTLLKSGKVRILFAYGSQGLYRMLRLDFDPESAELTGQDVFTTMKDA